MSSLDFLAYGHAANLLLFVGDTIAHSIDSIEDKMTMGIRGIVMTQHDVLGIAYTHLIHILLDKLCHEFICQARSILWLETDGNVPYWILDSLVHLSLVLKTFSCDNMIVRDYILKGNHFSFIFASVLRFKNREFNVFLSISAHPL